MKEIDPVLQCLVWKAQEYQAGWPDVIAAIVLGAIACLMLIG